MITIETRATVTEDGRLTVEVPVNIAPGEHDVVVVISEQPAENERSPLVFPTYDLEWPENLSTRREDLYGDDGR